jgi:hypothetical protein
VKTSRSVISVAVVMLAAGTVAGLTPSVASAAVPGLFYAWDMTSWDSNVYKSVRVSCPPGTVVIGGSFDLQGALGAVVLDDFIPSPTSLLVGAGEIVGPGEPSDGTRDSWQIVALAVCANPPPGYGIFSGTSDFKRTPRQAVQSVCPPGRAAVGGGASLSNGWGQVSITDLNIRSWGTQAGGRADVDEYSGNWSITTYAICADALPGWHVVETASLYDSQDYKTQAADCPPGEVVIGAAWAVGTPRQGFDRYITGVVISHPTVTNTAVATGVDINWQLRTSAVCALP